MAAIACSSLGGARWATCLALVRSMAMSVPAREAFLPAPCDKRLESPTVGMDVIARALRPATCALRASDLPGCALPPTDGCGNDRDDAISLVDAGALPACEPLPKKAKLEQKDPSIKIEIAEGELESLDLVHSATLWQRGVRSTLHLFSAFQRRS